MDVMYEWKNAPARCLRKEDKDNIKNIIKLLGLYGKVTIMAAVLRNGLI